MHTIDNEDTGVFKVQNIDGNLCQHSKGFMRITGDGMTLFAGTCKSTSWPLDGIRRYGYHGDIFIFECGRKCATGEGIYAFKCKSAPRLNATLHATILNRGSLETKHDDTSDVISNQDDSNSVN